MLSSVRSRWTRDLTAFAVIAAATIAARLPFLLRADRFFDSDEAVEGLMARHVLLGEFPAFLWGQRYKGVPEVYLSSAVFRAAGSSVVALKAVTLVCFVVFVFLNFRLVERACSRRVAWIATAFFIAGPPSLVLWTLSGSAEIVMTLLAGVVLLTAVNWWRRSSSSRALLLAGAALGFGLWIQQYILFYVVSLLVTVAITTPGWRQSAALAVRERVPPWLRVVLLLLAFGTVLYVVLGLLAFFNLGFDIPFATGRIVVSHPQKMWWIAGELLGVAALVAATAVFRRALVWPALGLLAGYAPALLGRISNSGMGAPIARLKFDDLLAALPDMTTVMLPMLFGFRDPGARPTVYPIFAIVIAVLIGLSFWYAHRLKLTPFFHLILVVAPVMFLISGSYIDAQSYRYLMPMYASLPIVYAIGIDGVLRASRAGGAALLVVVLLIFAAQQIDWYRRLEPDRESPAIIACLDRAGARAARAGYWLSYKLTFLTSERIVVAPIDGVDRYPPYSTLASSSDSIDAAGCR
jgi:hypothetical protein